MAWKIEYAASAAKTLEKIDRSTSRRIYLYMGRQIAPLENPRSRGKALTAALKRYWCYRVGDYRVIREIHDDRLVVTVVKIGNRREVYRKK